MHPKIMHNYKSVFKTIDIHVAKNNFTPKSLPTGKLRLFRPLTQLTQKPAGQLMELSKDEAVQEKVMEAARQFFANSNITVNLLPALIAGDWCWCCCQCWCWCWCWFWCWCWCWCFAVGGGLVNEKVF